jgi:hypothetical protein
MKIKNTVFLGAATLAIAAVAAYAAGIANGVTFRTAASFDGIVQATNKAGLPQYDPVTFSGHELVHLAMGRGVNDNTTPNQVLALTFACDLSAANLVVYDTNTSEILATIASSTTMQSVKQQDAHQTGPNRAQFITFMQVNPMGNATDGLAGGYFTVAGRVNLNPATGCPVPVVLSWDRDPLDDVTDNTELSPQADPTSAPLNVRTGLAHLVGVLNVVLGGTSDTVLVPEGNLSIRQELTIAPQNLD